LETKRTISAKSRLIPGAEMVVSGGGFEFGPAVLQR
jgi:hypothetical protein